MADLAILKLWLAEAEYAKHRLAIGEQEVSVSYEGKSASFTPADAFRLDAHIADLKRQVADLTGARRRRGPALMTF